MKRPVLIDEIKRGVRGVEGSMWKRNEPTSGQTEVTTFRGMPLLTIPWDSPTEGNAHRLAEHITRTCPARMGEVLQYIEYLESQVTV